MKLRPRYLAAAAAAALALAACGSGGGGSDDASNASSEATAGASTDTSTNTVSVARVEGLGDVLVDSTGLALYSADEEPDGEALCIDGCTSFWLPLEPGADAPTVAPGVPELAVVERPDGTQQVTADGRLLYTFYLDSPGDVQGDGFEDDFGDQHLTWHAVRVADDGTATTGTSTDSGASSGLPGYGD
jgi:predicted lipoprotein with Yx(FWY)xxD motif